MYLQFPCRCVNLLWSRELCAVTSLSYLAVLPDSLTTYRNLLLEPLGVSIFGRTPPPPPLRLWYSPVSNTWMYRDSFFTFLLYFSFFGIHFTILSSIFPVPVHSLPFYFLFLLQFPPFFLPSFHIFFNDNIVGSDIPLNHPSGGGIRIFQYIHPWGPLYHHLHYFMYLCRFLPATVTSVFLVCKNFSGVGVGERLVYLSMWFRVRFVLDRIRSRP